MEIFKTKKATVYKKKISFSHFTVASSNVHPIALKLLRLDALLRLTAVTMRYTFIS